MAERQHPVEQLTLSLLIPEANKWPFLAGLCQCCHQFACRIPATQLNRQAPHQQKLKRKLDRPVVAGRVSRNLRH